MPTHPLLTVSATELARRIREREVTSYEVVRAHVDHASRVNRPLRAIVAERYAEAFDEAREADARLARGDTANLPPFFGVPCTIKEAFALTGMPNTSGLVARKGPLAGQDATAVARLRAAGAIPIGVTNISELCMWMESSNRVYGRTSNAYHPAYTAGGSSGGEGAIVGSGASPFGLGSDVGGSIRMPAAFNGVFGHKPTGGLVPSTGQYPHAEGAVLRYLTTGPIARRAQDLMPLLRLMAGADGHDAGCDGDPSALGDPDKVDLGDLDVLVVETNELLAPSKDVLYALRAAADHLRRRGARVRTRRFPALRDSFQIWGAMLAADQHTSFSELLVNGGHALRPGRELARWAVGRSPFTFPALGLALLERLPTFSARESARWSARGHALRLELVDAIGDRGVLLYPPYGRNVPRHAQAFFPPLHWIYSAIFNVLEIPATAVPMGFDEHGLPVAVQVASVHGADHRCIGVALELERAFGGWRPPARWMS